MDVVSVAFEGMHRALERVDAAAERIAKGPPEPEVMVELMHAEVQMASNVRALRAADEMERRVLDLLG
jgi:hypothetical protein